MYCCRRSGIAAPREWRRAAPTAEVIESNWIAIGTRVCNTHTLIRGREERYRVVWVTDSRSSLLGLYIQGEWKGAKTLAGFRPLG